MAINAITVLPIAKFPNLCGALHPDDMTSICYIELIHNVDPQMEPE